MTFYKRIVLSYASIIIIPLTLLVIGVSFFSLRNQINKLEELSIAEISNDTQNVYKILKEFDSIETVIKTDDNFNLFLSNPENYDEEDTIEILINKTTLFEQIQSITPDIYSIRIFTNNQNVPERWPVILQSSRLSTIPGKWSLNYKASFLGNLNALKNESVCTTREIIKNRRLIGYFQISVRMEDFFPMVYNDMGTNLKQYIFQKDPVTGQLCAINQEIAGAKLLKPGKLKFIQKKMESASQNTGCLVFRPFYKVATWSYIPEMNIYIITENTSKDVIQSFATFIVTIVLSLLILVAALFLIVRYTTSRLMSGIYSVMDGMKKVREGDVNVQIPVSGLDEVAETQQSFNAMAKQLSSQIEQIKTEQSLIADTEMKAMQNQINAHFLYNVLETIRMQAVLADQDDISESLQVLGKMMRYCLRWRIHRVSLAQEIEYIRSYVYILNIRNDYVINLEIDVSDDFMDVEIPKMTLQPLIENAFVHAIEKTESDATLRVFAKLSEDKKRLILGVQDFGEGMSQEQVHQIKDYLADSTYERDSKGSIGLKNIQQRLTVFYGDEFRVEIDSKLGEGTTISVPVPFKRIE